MINKLEVNPYIKSGEQVVIDVTCTRMVIEERLALGKKKNRDWPNYYLVATRDELERLRARAATDEPGGYWHGAKYRIVKQTTTGMVRIDRRQLEAKCWKAATSKSRRCVDGPLKVTPVGKMVEVEVE